MSKIFGGLRANNKVSIKVKRGTVHALIGPNGSGKTTFINVVTGVYVPEEGEVHFCGKKHRRQARVRHRRDGHGPHVPEPADLAADDRPGKRDGRAPQPREGRVCREHDPHARLPGARGAEVKARALGLLQFVGLEKWADVPAGALPYGPQRHLEIARALALDPSCCILDEPAAGLNPAEVAS